MLNIEENQRVSCTHGVILTDRIYYTRTWKVFWKAADNTLEAVQQYAKGFVDTHPLTTNGITENKNKVHSSDYRKKQKLRKWHWIRYIFHQIIENEMYDHPPTP